MDEPTDNASTAIPITELPAPMSASFSPTGVTIKPFDSRNALADRLYRLGKPRRWDVLAALVVGLLIWVLQAPGTHLLFRNLLSNLPSGVFAQALDTLLYVLYFATAILTILSIPLMPILVAVIGAALTAQQTTASSYGLLLLTSLSNRQLIKAYLQATIQRTRVLWVFCLALTLPDVLLTLRVHPDLLIYTDTYRFAYRWVSEVILLVRVPFLLLGLTWGVWVAQRVRAASSAIVSAAIGMFVVQVLFYYVVVPTLWVIMLSAEAEGGELVGIIDPTELSYILQSTFFAMLILLLAGLLYALLPRRVPRRDTPAR